MKKSIKMSILVVFILIIVCTVVVLWQPWKNHIANDPSSSVLLSSDIHDSSSLPESSLFESSLLQNSSESSDSSMLESGLVSEDQPDSPDLNFKPSGSSYDDIMVNILTCLLSSDMKTLSSYVGSQGLRLSPTGSMTDQDIVLSADEVSDFFSLGTQTYGVYPGSGEAIRCSAEDYYNRYIAPSDFNFSAATVAFNEASDLEAVAGLVSNPKTVSYDYSPSVMEWKRLIMVYTAEGSGDVLCGIIYQDLTTG